MRKNGGGIILFYLAIWLSLDHVFLRLPLDGGGGLRSLWHPKNIFIVFWGSGWIFFFCLHFGIWPTSPSVRYSLLSRLRLSFALAVFVSVYGQLFQVSDIHCCPGLRLSFALAVFVSVYGPLLQVSGIHCCPGLWLSFRFCIWSTSPSVRYSLFSRALTEFCSDCFRFCIWSASPSVKYGLRLSFALAVFVSVYGPLLQVSGIHCCLGLWLSFVQTVFVSVHGPLLQVSDIHFFPVGPWLRFS